MDERRTLYPPIEPYDTGRVQVSDVHEIYYEQSGNPHGKPVVFLHGGPGGGTEAKQRRFFDPNAYRIVLFDQRGCGKSTPRASLVDNTTWHLVSDIERLRAQLGIARWLVFGGSWGSTLALAYAEAHPDRVTALVLRGIFLLRKWEIDWFYEAGGCSQIFPDAWEDFLAPIPPAEYGSLLRAYHRRLTGKDSAERMRAARAWSIWEGTTSCLLPNDDLISKSGTGDFADAFARIECHYFVNRGFLDGLDLLDRTNIDKIRHIPAVIVQGRYDVVCPLRSAWDLHGMLPEADLRIVRDAGHSAFEPGNVHELVSATDRFRVD